MSCVEVLWLALQVFIYIPAVFLGHFKFAAKYIKLPKGESSE